MIHDLALTTIREGATSLSVPAEKSSSGPGSSKMPVFYNPVMEFSRDLSVVLLANLLENGDSLLDGLAATGASGIRAYKETGKRLDLHLNDRNPLAKSLIERNLSLNDIVDATLYDEDLRSLLLRRRYHCVDIDPFGSPASYIPAAIEAVRNGGILCATATDTGTISGIFPSACLRRYSTVARRTPFCHELGVRNLLGFIAREAAKSDRGIEPLCSFYADHYIRSFVRVRRGARRADDSLRMLGYCLHDSDSLERRYDHEKSSGAMGPIWIASTCDPETLRGLHIPAHLTHIDRIASYISLLADEAAINRPFFMIDEIARKFRVDPPEMNLFLSRLTSHGKAMRTHYSPKSFSTDADMDQISEALRER